MLPEETIMTTRNRIPKRVLVKAAKEEAKEHPWLTAKEARKVATDHLSKHPYYMHAMGVAEQIMAKEEASNKPKRRRQKPNPTAFMNRGYDF
jgi:hypothetical protein